MACAVPGARTRIHRERASGALARSPTLTHSVTPTPKPTPKPTPVIPAGSCTRSGTGTSASWTCDLFKDEGAQFQASGNVRYVSDGNKSGGNLIFQPEYTKLYYPKHAKVDQATVSACQAAQATPGAVSDEASTTQNLYNGVMACSFEAGGLVAFVEILDVSHVASKTRPELKLKVWFEQG